ncbi:MAG: glycosyltransferase [Candidatus Iainarchaeum archaeon]|uniref:Glycosyltransferase n=1 Tax=Candidatus Iainarchaeum sp. TaxID=3101447 RepID=A0A7T9DJ98_9ARCH|nr:MAG: glycosyltransferase [Candidatus Diapherotrites archaeon]
MQKIVVIVPVFNMDLHIQNVVRSLNRAKEQKVISDYVVVDDGSADTSGRLAEALGARVLSLRANAGKSFAFCKGLFEVARENPDYIVTLDANLKPFDPVEIVKLVDPLLHNPSQKMTIGEDLDGFSLFSGQRAIRFSALKPLFLGNKAWLKLFGIALDARGHPVLARRAGYGLEEALNYTLTKNEKGQSNVFSLVVNTGLKKDREARMSRSSFDPFDKHIRLSAEMDEAGRIIAQRQKKAALLNRLRQKKKFNQARRARKRIRS